MVYHLRDKWLKTGRWDAAPYHTAGRASALAVSKGLLGEPEPLINPDKLENSH